MAVGHVRLVGDVAVGYWAGFGEVSGASDAARGHGGRRLTQRQNVRPC